MSLKLSTPRKTNHFAFASPSQRDDAYNELNGKYTDVLFHKSTRSANTLLVCLTGSFSYDTLVKKAVEDLGGSLCAT